MTSLEAYSEQLLIETSMLQRMAYVRTFYNPHKPRRPRRQIVRRFHILFMLPELGEPPLRAEDIAARFGVSMRNVYRDMQALRPVVIQYAGLGGGYWRKPVDR